MSEKLPTPLFARKEWISACQFHDHTDEQVLTLVRDKVSLAIEAWRAGGEPAVVLLDLDSTLYDTACRTKVIVLEWLKAHRNDIPKRVLEAMHPLEEGHVSYSLLDLFAALGLSTDDPEVALASEHLKGFWRPRFFSNAYLPHDRPYPGAAAFVSALHAMGTVLCYLTGRDAPGMETGTRANLSRDGFPIGDARTHLFMKPAREGDDYLYKVGVAETIRTYGNLVASFENEPRNLMGLKERFPGALHVFVETVCSDHPAPHGEGLYRLKGFPIIK